MKVGSGGWRLLRRFQRKTRSNIEPVRGRHRWEGAQLPPFPKTMESYSLLLRKRGMAGPTATSLAVTLSNLLPGDKGEASGSSVRRWGDTRFLLSPRFFPGAAEQTGRKDSGITKWKNRRFVE